MKKHTDIINDIPHPGFFWTLLICLVLVSILYYVDLWTGSELSIAILYLLPVTLAVLMSGRLLGYLVSAISTAAWLISDWTEFGNYSSALIPVWNGLVRLGVYAIFCGLIARLVQNAKVMKELSLHDSLTGAANNRFFEEYADREVKTAVREGKAVTLAFMDLDNFKQVNDRLGHEAGDEALKLFAKTIQSCIRPIDMLARFGGDEFVLLMPGLSYAEADAALSRIRAKVAESMNSRGWNVTSSAGAVTFDSVPVSIAEMRGRADALMYEVKKSGKNSMMHEQYGIKQSV